MKCEHLGVTTIGYALNGLCVVECNDCGEFMRMNIKKQKEECPYCGKTISIVDPPEPGYNPTEDMDAEDRGPGQEGE